MRRARWIYGWAWAPGLAAWLIAVPGAAHEDFPAQWCGGEDCRYAEPGELIVSCGAVLVESEALSGRAPASQISTWNGDRPAICARKGKLNQCNPAKGDCEGRDGLGLLVPEQELAEWRRKAAEACKAVAREAFDRGQAAPGLALPGRGGFAGGGPGGGGFGGGSGGGGSVRSVLDAARGRPEDPAKGAATGSPIEVAVSGEMLSDAPKVGDGTRPGTGGGDGDGAPPGAPGAVRERDEGEGLMPIPAPAAIWLLLAATAALGAAGRRRRV